MRLNKEISTALKKNKNKKNNLINQQHVDTF